MVLVVLVEVEVVVQVMTLEMVLMEQLIQEEGVVRLDIVQALVKVVMEEKVWLL